MTKETRITIRHIADLFHIHPEQRDLFEQWLAEYTRQQREEAYDEGAKQTVDNIGRTWIDELEPLPNPYREVES